MTILGWNPSGGRGGAPGGSGAGTDGMWGGLWGGLGLGLGPGPGPGAGDGGAAHAALLGPGTHPETAPLDWCWAPGRATVLHCSDECPPAGW